MNSAFFSSSLQSVSIDVTPFAFKIIPCVFLYDYTVCVVDFVLRWFIMNTVIHRVKWHHSTISMLWGNTAYCVKLTGKDLSHYSNEIESVALRRCPYYHYLTEKVMLQWQRILTASPTSWWKTSSGIDMVWRNYVTVTQCTRNMTPWQWRIFFHIAIAHITVTELFDRQLINSLTVQILSNKHI